MFTFEPGQLVTASEFDRYAFTDKGKPLEVLRGDIDGLTKVKALWGVGTVYELATDTLCPMYESELLQEGQQMRVILSGAVKVDVKVVNARFVTYQDFGVEAMLDDGTLWDIAMKHILSSNVKGGLHV